MTEPKTENRGGKREGAGRKDPAIMVVQIQARISKEGAAGLRAKALKAGLSLAAYLDALGRAK